MTTNKTIKYYRMCQYGIEREFVHPESAGDVAILRQLTGQKTITGVMRELLRDLTGGQLEFVEVLAPRATTQYSTNHRI